MAESTDFLQGTLEAFDDGVSGIVCYHLRLWAVTD